MRTLTRWEKEALEKLRGRHPRLFLALLVTARLLIEFLAPFIQTEESNDER